MATLPEGLETECVHKNDVHAQKSTPEKEEEANWYKEQANNHFKSKLVFAVFSISLFAASATTWLWSRLACAPSLASSSHCHKLTVKKKNLCLLTWHSYPGLLTSNVRLSNASQKSSVVSFPRTHSPCALSKLHCFSVCPDGGMIYGCSLENTFYFSPASQFYFALGKVVRSAWKHDLRRALLHSISLFPYFMLCNVSHVGVISCCATFFTWNAGLNTRR